jgi:hypothetical protein
VGKRRIHPNQGTVLQLPYSEVCMHLRVAGTRMRARLQPGGMVQLLGADGRQFSFPITAAEAGLDHDHDGWYSVVADPPDPLSDPPDHADPRAAGEHRAVLEAVSEPLDVGNHGAAVDGPAGPLSWHPTLGDLAVPDPDPDEQP